MNDELARSLRVESLTALGALALAGVMAVVFRRQARIVRATEFALNVAEDELNRVLRLHPPIVIGRGSDADLRVHDLHASRLHAIIDIEDGFAFVEDLGSRNGTLVNARPIDGRVRISPGDEIGVGRVRIVFSGEVPWT